MCTAASRSRTRKSSLFSGTSEQTLARRSTGSRSRSTGPIRRVRTSRRRSRGPAGRREGALAPDLRRQCAKELSTIDVAVHAIGGVVPLMESYRFRDLVRVIIASRQGLRPDRPVHLFGAGHPMIFALAALLGCAPFESASYHKYARAGRMMFPDGTCHI